MSLINLLHCHKQRKTSTIIIINGGSLSEQLNGQQRPCNCSVETSRSFLCLVFRRSRHDMPNPLLNPERASQVAMVIRQLMCVLIRVHSASQKVEHFDQDLYRLCELCLLVHFSKGLQI